MYFVAVAMQYVIEQILEVIEKMKIHTILTLAAFILGFSHSNSAIAQTLSLTDQLSSSASDRSRTSYFGVDYDDITSSDLDSLTTHLVNGCSRLYIEEICWGDDGPGGDGTYIVGWKHYDPYGLMPFLGDNCQLCFVKDIREFSDLAEPGAVIGAGIRFAW